METIIFLEDISLSFELVASGFKALSAVCGPVLDVCFLRFTSCATPAIPLGSQHDSESPFSKYFFERA